MRSCSIFCGIAIAGLSLLNTACTHAQTAAVPQPAQQAAPTAWAKSVKIKAIAVPETDVSQLLDLNMWRFDIMAPKPTHIVDFIVELQERGKSSIPLVFVHIEPRFGWPTNRHLGIFVGQYPLNDDLRDAAKAKYQIHLRDFRSARHAMIGNGTSSTISNNPFSRMGAIATSLNPEQRPDGSFVLIYGDKKSFQPQGKPSDAALVFRVEERE